MRSERWTASGEWIGVPYVDQGVAELLVRHKAIRLLEGAGLLEEDRVRLLLAGGRYMEA